MYHGWLIEQDYAPSRISFVIKVVRSFYNHNDIFYSDNSEDRIHDEEFILIIV